MGRTILRLNHNQYYTLTRNVETFLNSRSEPLKNVSEAEKYFSTICGFKVTRNHLAQACRNLEIDVQKVYTQTQANSPMAVQAAKYRELEQRVARIEELLTRP